MTEAHLNLVVIRVPDIEQAHAFYSALGLTLKKHAHGQGPEHYATDAGPVVFEIYPQGATGGVTNATRLGFSVSDVTKAVTKLSKLGAKIVSAPKESPWGLRAVIKDPFGHKVELLGR